MPSSLAWLDTDEIYRKRSLEIIDLFKDQGTVVEIGIGTIRDTFADICFPLTSVLHIPTGSGTFARSDELRLAHSMQPFNRNHENFRQSRDRMHKHAWKCFCRGTEGGIDAGSGRST